MTDTRFVSEEELATRLDDALGMPTADPAVSALEDPTEWREELPSMHEHFAKFGEQLPSELRRQLDGLEEKLGSD